MRILLDHIPIKVKNPDLDGDGVTGGTESVTRKFDDAQRVHNPTELGETIKEINNDSIDHSTRMSSIDMKTRLHSFEIRKILKMDALVGLRVLPTSCLLLTRQKKRLNVSEQGKGRAELVQMVAGKRENDKLSTPTGILHGMKNWFTPQR